MTSVAPQFIDSHAHLDFYKPEERAGVFERMRIAKTAAISIGTQSKDWDEISSIVASAPDCVLGFTVGVHPSEVKENWREEINALETFLSKNNANVVGVGECGLDFFRLEKEKNATDIVKWQRAAFEAQLSIISQTKLPVVIHSRGAGAFKEIIETIERAKVDWRRFVFHCFSEGPNEVKWLNERGARASFTGIITFKNGQQMRDAMLVQPIELTMIETDSPFLSPEPFRGGQNDPSRVGLVAKKTAELLRIKEEELFPMLIENTKSFFGV
jgi:TatD DNase family protein